MAQPVKVLNVPEEMAWGEFCFVVFALYQSSKISSVWFKQAHFTEQLGANSHYVGTLASVQPPSQMWP